jgi:hypothetical protein
MRLDSSSAPAKSPDNAAEREDGDGRGTVSADQKAFVMGGTNERLDLSTLPQKKGDDWIIVVSPASTR